MACRDPATRAEVSPAKQASAAGATQYIYNIRYVVYVVVYVVLHIQQHMQQPTRLALFSDALVQQRR